MKLQTRGSLEKSERVSEILERFKKVCPNPKCELIYFTPFQLLVSVVLSAQTTDKQVNKVMTPIYEKGFTFEDVLNMGEQKLLEKIKSIGLAPSKAKNIFKTCHILQEKYEGNIPKTRHELEALPGVGRKTASVLLGELFNQPTIAVDTHVQRVSRRLKLHNLENPNQIEDKLLKIIPSSYLPKAHHWLILHGRYTCKAQNPQCDVCIIADLCPSFSRHSKNTKHKSLKSTKSSKQVSRQDEANFQSPT